MSKTVIIAGFFPPPITGQGLATQRLAELLSPHYDVHRVNLREGEEELSLKVYSRLFHKINQYSSAGKRLKAVLNEHPEAVVFWTAISPQVFGHFRDLMTIVPAFTAKHRVYGVIHWGKFATLFQSPVTTLTAQRLANRLTGFVFNNVDRARQCERWISPSRQYLIPNTPDLAVLCSEEEITQKIKDHDARSHFHVLFLSNMIREKGYWDVLEALRMLHEQQLPIRATFAGQWLSEKDRMDFEAYCQQHGLDSVIHHAGKVTNRDDIKALYLSADVFILPSYLIEAQPVTITEALNAGCPIITTRLGGQVDMVKEDIEGLFVPPQDPAAIADALRRMMDPLTWKRMALAARHRHLTEHGADHVTQLWKQIIESS